jgi:hypothetical protein
MTGKHLFAGALMLLSGCVSRPMTAEFRLVTLKDGTLIFGDCDVPYEGAIADTMPPGGPCVDWEMWRLERISQGGAA